MGQNQVGAAVFVAERRSDLPGMRKHTFDENDNYEIICLRGPRIIRSPILFSEESGLYETEHENNRFSRIANI